MIWSLYNFNNKTKMWKINSQIKIIQILKNKDNKVLKSLSNNLLKKAKYLNNDLYFIYNSIIDITNNEYLYDWIL